MITDLVKKILLYAFAALIIISGIFACADLIKTYTSSSNIAGQIKYNNNGKTTILEHNAQNAVFSVANNYKHTFELNGAVFDGTTDEYTLLVNGNLTSNIEVDAAFIYGDFGIVFYDTSGNVSADVTVGIKVTFLANKTRIELTAPKTKNDLSHLYTYMMDYGLNIEVVKVGEVINE